jgi:hypothetical protein
VGHEDNTKRAINEAIDALRHEISKQVAVESGSVVELQFAGASWSARSPDCLAAAIEVRDADLRVLAAQAAVDYWRARYLSRPLPIPLPMAALCRRARPCGYRCDRAIGMCYYWASPSVERCEAEPRACVASRWPGATCTRRRVGNGFVGTNCANIRSASTAPRRVSSSRQRFAIMSSRTRVTATSSGAGHFKVCASVVMTAPSATSSCTAIVPMSDLMAGRSTRVIRSTHAGDKLEAVDATTSGQNGRSVKIIEEFRALS